MVGFKRPKGVEGLPSNVQVMCQERRKARIIMLKNPEQADVKEMYKIINKKVKSAVKFHKKQKLELTIYQLEEDFRKNNSRNLFKSVPELERKQNRSLSV